MSVRLLFSIAAPHPLHQMPECSEFGARKFGHIAPENEDILQAVKGDIWYNWGAARGEHMKKAVRTVVYDDELHIEAYRFDGMMQPFPNHFHAYYVIGLVEGGARVLSCKGREYMVKRGDILLFNPGDNHACTQSGGGALDYRGLNITKEVMLDLTEEVTGKRELPGFSQTVIFEEEAACCLRALHELMMRGFCEFEKEERLLSLASLLIQRYGQPFEACVPACREEIERACDFMERHYAEHICLEQICRSAGLSKSTLLRSFTKSKGVTPYSYLENIRIGRARKLLEQGAAPIEAALQTGFSDQSHFTNCFSRFIGLTPGAYREIFSAKSTEGLSHES